MSSPSPSRTDTLSTSPRSSKVVRLHCQAGQWLHKASAIQHKAPAVCEPVGPVRCGGPVSGIRRKGAVTSVNAMEMLLSIKVPRDMADPPAGPFKRRTTSQTLDEGLEDP